MNITKIAMSLINTISDDPEDYPDMAAFRRIQDKVAALREAVGIVKQPKVLVYVEGGVVQGAKANTEVAFDVFDVDDLEADGLSRDEIEKEWNKVSKGMKGIY